MKRQPAKAVHGLYVYLIGRRKDLQKAIEQSGLPDSLEPDEALSLIHANELAAIVSSVPLERYGEGRFEKQLKDPLWAADKVMRHQTITAFFSLAFPVVPLRFGVIYSDPNRIEAMLKEHSDNLHAAIDRVQGCEEWALNVYADRSVLADKITKLSPKLAELRTRARASSQGKAYLLEKQLERLRAVELKSYVKQATDEIASSLARKSKGMKRLAAPDQKQAADIVGRFAYLVQQPNVADFKKQAEKLAGRHGANGFHLELTGPWPAYNFVE